MPHNFIILYSWFIRIISNCLKNTKSNNNYWEDYLQIFIDRDYRLNTTLYKKKWKTKTKPNKNIKKWKTNKKLFIRARLQKVRLKRLHACTDELWRHVHSQSAIKVKGVTCKLKYVSVLSPLKKHAAHAINWRKIHLKMILPLTLWLHIGISLVTCTKLSLAIITFLKWKDEQFGPNVVISCAKWKERETFILSLSFFPH